jgi:chaperonin GroES
MSDLEEMGEVERSDEMEPAIPLNVDAMVSDINIATKLEEIYLNFLGKQIVDNYKEDEDSRKDWVDKYEQAMKIATQVYEKKNTPWENASNVRFPLITIGAMAFHARAYPTLLPSQGVVATGYLGIDYTGEKSLIAKLVAAHMNYQFEHEMEGWEEDMDRLLITLPITGCEFKKTYYDPQKGYNCSEYVRSSDVVINYYAKSVEEADRKTHILSMNSNEIEEMKRAGMFLDVDLGQAEPRADTTTNVLDKSIGFKAPSTVDTSTPFKILEWHGWVDLDGDDYKEPYVVTVDEKSGKVLRIVARYRADGITKNDSQILKITPVEYFTKYDFIPNPSGGIYGIGFGILLGPLNESSNTLINQLVDAGTLSNRQSGFISRNLRIRNGRATFSPGEWKEVNASGADLRQGILPLPVREPSMVLFQLLNTLISAGERLTSTTDMMVGENPGQNQKATTTMAVLDQGMKVFSAIYKRIRRAMTKEFKKVFQLNAYYLDEDKTKILFDGQATMKKDMYNKDHMVVFPSADPNVSSTAEKMQMSQMLLGMIPMGGFNAYEIKRRALEAMGVPDPESLLLDPATPPAPDPKLIKAQQDGVEQDFRRKLDTIEFMTTSRNKAKELDIKEEEAATNRLTAMLDGFAKGAKVSHDSRALVQKELSDRRQVNATKSKQGTV